MVLPWGAKLSRGWGPVMPDRATGLCLDLVGGVFSHVVAGLDPDGVVHDVVHDRVGMYPGTEALVVQNTVDAWSQRRSRSSKSILLVLA